jgi:hypothetical protein
MTLQERIELLLYRVEGRKQAGIRITPSDTAKEILELLENHRIQTDKIFDSVMNK